ncbi:nucleotidyltransferase family protein [bacterium]|nr:nucleotidyltransferase family protein [bacterium]
MIKNSNIAILILAAGNSSRMGRPKQLLPWKNTSLLNHSIQLAHDLNQGETYVVLGAHRDVITPHIRYQNINLICNDNWSFGIGASISEGIKVILNSKSSYDGALIMLADQPLLHTNYLTSLIKFFNTESEQIIASSYGDKSVGVPAIFHRSFFKELSQLTKNFGAKKVIKRHMNRVKILEALQLITDIDTQADYDNLYKINHQL